MASTILSDNGVTSGVAGLKTSADSDGTLALQTTTAGGTATTAVTINTSQNVGVNTTLMYGKLNVKQSSEGAGTNGVGGFSVQRSVNDSYCGIQYQTTPDAWAISASYSTTGAYKPLIFETSDLERMRIDSSGNVQVGTTTQPSESQARQTLATSSSTYLQFARTATTVGGSLIGTSGQNFIVQTYTGAIGSETYTERMRIDSSGNLLFNSGYGSVATAYGCRAWVNFNGTGTVAIRASGNVTSITDNGTGNYTVNFTTAMPDANYSVAGWANDSNSSGSVTIVSAFANHTYSASACQIYCYETTATVDPTIVCATFFR